MVGLFSWFHLLITLAPFRWCRCLFLCSSTGEGGGDVDDGGVVMQGIRGLCHAVPM